LGNFLTDARLAVGSREFLIDSGDHRRSEILEIAVTGSTGKHI